MSVVLIVLAVIVVLIVAVLGLAASRPNAFRVSRSILIKAKPDKIYPMIDDFHAWIRWSPYEGRDPNMTRTYGAVAQGKGAVYEWSGEAKTVGAGRMEITEAAAPFKTLIKLDFLKPFEGHNTAEFTLEPEADATKVTWAMFGPAPFMHKLMGMVFNMDRMIGKDFETGLANLKGIAEG